MKKLLCVACLAALSLAACDEPKQAKIEAPTGGPAATKDADKPSADKPVDKPADKIPAKPLDGPLFGDLKLPFDHHILVDKTNVVANNTQRTLALETVDKPFADAVKELETKLTAAGFQKTDDQLLDGTLIRGYNKGSMMEPGGQSVRLQGSAYAAEGEGAALKSTGQLSITVRTAQ